MSAHETLGLLLVRENLISRPQLYDALRLQRQTGRLLGTCLLSLDYIKADALLAMLARQLSIPALPPGALNRASPEAVRRVPREIACRLRILPYSWDGQMLGVAVADGRVLGQLYEVAYHARAAVGAYVALETEIEAVLRAVYPEPADGSPPAGRVAESTSRPRPPQVVGPAGEQVGVHQNIPTAALASPHATAIPVRSEPLTRGEPSAPPHDADLAGHVLVRVGFFDAVERLYEAPSPDEIGRMVGRALLNYFRRVLVITADDQRLCLVGYAGVSPPRREAALSAAPLTVSKLGNRQIAYGLAVLDARAAELGSVFGFEPGVSALIATVGAGSRQRLVMLADNDAASDLYDDLHDIELLFKEAETGLGMLLDKADTAPSG